ncbi:MAG: hypothetical protein J7598_16425 [Mitsuaria chitosanitabida]|uniref:hypothetical protein n=1 Tax=Roseateles chitosanitabidus TaxID=65048 RepID=UPI001B1454E4|nr:hypothetical protein [Roseateles chitosanitabidus]MBO9688188.1 hypothetical protein [Roseateles chitosanitabidus]
MSHPIPCPRPARADGRRPARGWLWTGALVLLAQAAVATAQSGGPSMEERLRTQLRATTTQLQQAQAELAELKSAGGGKSAKSGKAAPADDGALTALRKDLTQARAQLATEREARERQRDDGQQLKAQTEAAMQRAAEQLNQYRAAYDELLRLARASDADRQRLGAELVAQRGVVARCEAHNAQVYDVSQELLRAYETMDATTLLRVRQPFAGRIRVRFEEVAQQFGDRLHAGRFDARAVKSEVEGSTPAQVPAPAQAPAESPASDGARAPSTPSAP